MFYFDNSEPTYSLQPGCLKCGELIGPAFDTEPEMVSWLEKNLVTIVQEKK